MSADIEIYNPDVLGPPLGQYHHVTRVKAPSEFIYLAGMLSANSSGIVGHHDFDAQADQVFDNIFAALDSAGAGWENVVKFTTYLVHSEYIPEFMEFRKRKFPDMFPNGMYPPNTLLVVDRLVQEPFLIEVETVAVL